MDLESPMMKHRDGQSGGFNLVRFRWETEKNNGASERVGRPIHDKVLKVFITSPGITTQEMVHVVERHVWQPDDAPALVKTNHEIKARFGELLDAWKNNTAESLTGTPLSELKALDVAWVASLREMGIHTIEALASIQDGHLQMGVRPLREQAKAYLEQAKGMEPVAKLAAENEALRNQVEYLAEQVQTLNALLSEDDSAPKRGRPRKDAA